MTKMWWMHSMENVRQRLLVAYYLSGTCIVTCTRYIEELLGLTTRLREVSRALIVPMEKEEDGSEVKERERKGRGRREMCERDWLIGPGMSR